MQKKVLKIILTVMLSVVALLVLVAVLIYIPSVQRFIKDKALTAVSSATGMNITMDNFRMRFPAVLRLENIDIVDRQGDTVLHSNSVGVRIALLPLIGSEVRARGLELDRTYINLSDSAGSFRLRGTVNSVTVPLVYVRLKDHDADVGGLDITGANFTMSLADGPEDDSPPDTTLWNIALAAATLSDIYFKMEGTGGRLDAYIRNGEIDNAAVSLETQTVNVATIKLDTASYHYSPPVPNAPDSTAIDTDPSQPWLVRVENIQLNNNSARYTASGRDFDSAVSKDTGLFDAGEIAVDSLYLNADSLYNRGGDIRLRLARLSLTESSGLDIREGSGGFAMDSSGVRISDFRLITAGSRIDARITGGDGILSANPDAPVEGEINADIASDELFMFIRPSGALATFRGKEISVDGNISGTLAALNIPRLRVNVPGTADLTIEGYIASVTDPSRLRGDVTFRGTTGDMRFVHGMIADTTLRNRFDIPSGMNINGSASFSPGVYAPDVTIRIDTGSLHIKGDVNTYTQRYAAELEAVGFPVYRFLPHDSLGLATLDLAARGNGFNPLAAGSSTDIDLTVNRFDYLNFPYTDITVRAILNAGRLTGQFHSGNQPLSADLTIEGTIADSAYLAHVAGRVENANLTQLGLSPSPLAVAGILDASLTVYPDTAYIAALNLDTLRVNYGDRTETIARAIVNARAGRSGVSLVAESGDLHLDFVAKVPLDSIGGRIQRTSDELNRQIDARSLDMAALQDALPPLRLDLEAGTGNMLHSLLLDYGYGFNNLVISVSTLDNEPLRAAAVAKGFQTSGVTLDTLNLWLRRNDNRLEYALRLRNRPGNIEQMAMVRARGYAEDNKAEINILQRNRQDSTGFRFGIEATLLDSALTFTLIPENPTFGYRPWTVNAGNYFTYDFDRELYADMRIDGDGEHIHIVSAPLKGFERGAVRVDMGSVDIATTLELIPGPPPLGGKLSTDLLFGMAPGTFALDGSVGIDSATWDGHRIGDVELTADFRSDSTVNSLNDVVLNVDGSRVLTARGTLGFDATNVEASLTSFPLTAINPFLPEEVVQMDGEANGQVNVTLQNNDLDLDGQLGLGGAGITVPITGTRYTLPTQYLTFSDSRIVFDNYSILSPNGQPLEIDGSLDLADLSNPEADLTLTARNFEAVNSQRSGGSDVYGRALTDIDLSAIGRLNALRVRGDISILTGTDVTYTLPDNDLEIADRSQDIVTFISFADTAALFIADSAALLSVWGMDMLVNVDIQDNVEATVNLSADGNNRAELTGDGNLTFTMNTQGDSRFTGRYNLSGGTVVYNPPVISAKTFTVNDGSYVEWRGDIANPIFNVTATESLRTTVTSGDGSSSNVTFNVTVSLTNTLDDLELVFDLAAPGDLAIQNQLQTLSADQRSQQALALLIYNTYTGPGTTATVDVNNPLNSFIEKQINQWARNSLPGVDLSFGVTSVDDSATGGGQHTDYSYRVSKSLFDDRVKVTVGGSINPDASTNENLKDNFVDDISLEYRLSNRDNMFLKAYRYNTQESILEGEVVETGFGFVARKSMNKLKELFRLRRSPERKALKQSRREVKQRVRQAERVSGADPAKEQKQNDPLTLNNSEEETSALRQENPGTTTNEESDKR